VRAHVVVYSLVAGCCWGAFAGLLGARAFGDELWTAVAASPLIGAIVGAALHDVWMRVEGWRRSLVSLASVYLGAALFAVPIGAHTAVVRGAGLGPLWAAVGDAEVSILWGVTMTGYLLFLWPLAHATHAGIRRLTEMR
jgi:hypothetical protein